MRRLHRDLHRVRPAGRQVREGGLHLVLLWGSRLDLIRLAKPLGACSHDNESNVMSRPGICESRFV